MDQRSHDVALGDPPRTRHELNADAPWDSFDPAAYVDHNYRLLRSDDEEILIAVRDHFSDHFRSASTASAGPRRGIDVGAGANLYPALAMLPWCDEITLLERSAANVQYLHAQRSDYDSNWNPFWDVLTKEGAYRDLAEDPRARFKRTVEIREGNLFDLDPDREQWSMGTMFFVAESMSTSYEEFRTGVERFLRALEPGAPYAAAFMEGSVGYEVGSHRFPACSVGETEVGEALTPLSEGKIVLRSIGMPDGPLRPGYEGMIVACGRRSSE
ncbi:SCO2525 family SAM-dependent methyltransferase [Actinacidiphila acididurans]|uniref:Methyltransferase n=1 Tax=Actinacidiphila acididurans TaxID=2784346 RepID=A0ABS2TWB6_9ACTN|nr:SCO2525 family SAM-dependent methyltransferase [Actinacidiphila acididurans]MBM9507632.1 methyltransferase [Actinacidiphila acididurans]